MLVVVGSMNPVKLSGVEKAYRKVFEDIEVKGVKVSSGVSPQPLSLEETVEGAVNRAKNALKSVEGAEHGVGVEAGWVAVRDSWIDVQVAAIFTKSGELSIGFSPAFPLPKIVVDSVLSESIEMEDIMIRLTGIDAIGEKEGAIGYFTKNMVKREDLTYYAVLMALLPFMPWNRRIFSGR
ncbi:MAG: inosine/xanthosine triphosphatase [Thermoprotei archaeon]|nr:MAG: inosine/xanthosine triphosphatase [Thermoprotei archaeon]